MSKVTLNKAEFVDFLAQQNDATKADAERFLNFVTNGIQAAIQKGYGITLVGFGNFEIQHRAARQGRNPKTGAKMDIKAYNHPVFRAGKKLKDACN